MLVAESLPVWLAEARGEGTSQDRSRPVEFMDLKPGDLWVFADKPTADARLRRVVLILDADRSTRTVTAALTSTELDFASQDDVLIASSATGAPYDLMAETALFARLPWAHACMRVGAVDDGLLDELVDFVWEERPERLEQLRGAPWTEPANAERDRFEEEELADLRALAHETDPRFGGSYGHATVGVTIDAVVADSAPTGNDACEGAAEFGPVPVVYAELLSAHGDMLSELSGSVSPALSDADTRLLAMPAVDALLSSECMLEVQVDDTTHLLLVVSDTVGNRPVTLISPSLKRLFPAGFVGWTMMHNAVFVEECEA